MVHIDIIENPCRTQTATHLQTHKHTSTQNTSTIHNQGEHWLAQTSEEKCSTEAPLTYKTKAPSSLS